MKWPDLVPARVCKTPVVVHLTDGINERGAPKVVKTIACQCNYKEQSRQVVDAERRLVLLSACLLFNGDIAPGLDALEGHVFVDGSTTERMVAISGRGRNPDGTVNYTKLELK